MANGRDKHPIEIAGGRPCPKCGQAMQRFEHSKNWKPLLTRGHYIFWDRCHPCKYFQHYHDAYRAPAT